MSDVMLRKIGHAAREAAIQVAWAQWAHLGASALQDTKERTSSIIDPEALLLLSLHLEPTERRLRDFVHWWAGAGSDLLSVQRTKTLLKRFPPESKERLGAFAYWAAEAGDKRWRRYAPDEALSIQGRKEKGIQDPRLDVPASLVLRLRAGFGVNAKADVLAYLLGIEERLASRQETTDATGYSRATVRGALSDLARAQFIQEASDRPARYFAPVRPWAVLLGFDGPRSTLDSAPVWRHWASVFAFLAQVDYWAQETDKKNESAYLLSSRARDLFERHKSAFERNRMQVPRPESYRGAAYLEGFQETIDILADWMREHL